MQHRWHRGVLCRLRLEHIDVGALCLVSLFFLLRCEDNTQSIEVSKNKIKYYCCSRALGPAATHAPHPNKRPSGVYGQCSRDCCRAQSTHAKIAAAATATWYLTWRVIFFSTSISHRSRWFLPLLIVLFKYLKIISTSKAKFMIWVLEGNLKTHSVLEVWVARGSNPNPNMMSRKHPMDTK